MKNKSFLIYKVITYIILYTLFNLFSIYIINTSPIFSLLIISSLGIILLFYIWKLVYKDNFEINNFGSFLLLSCIAYKIFNILVLLSVEDPFDIWPNGITSIVSLSIPMKATSIMIGEFLSIFGTIIISITWFFLGGTNFSSNDTIKSGNKKNNSLQILLLYVLASSIYFIKLKELSLFIYISSFIIIFTTIHLNKLNNKNIHQHNLIRAIIMLTPFIIYSIKTGMKEAVIVFLIPVLIDFFYRFKTFYGKIFLIFGSFTSFLIFTLIADYIRSNYWGTKQSLSISRILNYLSITIQSIDFEFIFALLTKALLRFSPLFYQGWTISLTYIKEIHYTGLFSNILLMFIPRFLWSAKPLNNPEHEMTVIFYGDKIAETTNEASGLFSELYLKEGILGFLLISFLLGLYIFLLQKFAFAFKNKLVFEVFNFVLIYFACRLHEFYFNAIFPGFFFFLLIIITITGIINLFSTILHTKPIIFSS